MLLYVNGDRLSGGAGAVNDFVSAGDDMQHPVSGNTAHPDNLMHSYVFYNGAVITVTIPRTIDTQMPTHTTPRQSTSLAV